MTVGEKVLVDYLLFTDGGCWNSGVHKGVGAYAFVVLDEKGNHVYHDSKLGEDGTTNNRMEYLAFIEGIKWIISETKTEKTKVVAYTDSQLLINTFTKWVFGWNKSGKINKMKNPDLLKEMLDLHRDLRNLGIDVQLNWVRCHSGDKWNEFCDSECTKLIQEKIKNKTTIEVNFVEGKKLEPLPIDEEIEITGTFKVNTEVVSELVEKNKFNTVLIKLKEMREEIDVMIEYIEKSI